MGPTSNETTTLRRQSCDRCHNQKVRCTRTDNRKTGACDRCLRKGVLCTYSSCLPKGRPSLGRTSEASPGPKSPSKAAAAAFWTPPESVAGTSKSQSVFPITFSDADRQHRDITPVSHVDADADADTDINMNAQGDASVFPGSTETFTDDWASWWPQDHIADNVLGSNPTWALNLDTELELHPPASLGFSEPFPRGQDRVKSGNAGYGDTGEEGIGRDINVAGNGSTRGGSSHRVLTADKSDVEPSIALSQLSTRLSQLLGSSRFFLAESLDTSRQSRNHDPALQVQLGIEAVFKSINTWLVHGSGNTNSCSSLDLGPTNAFDLPQHVFAASSHLLGILRHSGLYAGTTTTKSSSDASNHSSSVVHHLVLVCSTLLLNMYVAILIALQRSANALNSSPRPHASDPAEPNDDMDVASRGHLQLLSVAQLCSYFIKRQNQTLDLIISSSQGPQDNDCRQSASFDTVNALRAEVKQRMGRLQESLLYNPLT